MLRIRHWPIMSAAIMAALANAKVPEGEPMKKVEIKDMEPTIDMRQYRPSGRPIRNRRYGKMKGLRP